MMKSQDIEKSLLANKLLMKHFESKLTSYLNPVDWNPDCIQLEYVQEKQDNKQLDTKDCFIIANRLSIAYILREISSIARSKYKAKAYLHWFMKFGMENEDFEKAFETVNGIVDSYYGMVIDQ
jgi:hypothetical protein